MVKEDLVYVIPAGQYGKEGVLALLEQHPEIKFVSLVGVDLAGNDTDEKIPISTFFDDYDDFFNATAFQTCSLSDRPCAGFFFCSSIISSRLAQFAEWVMPSTL